MEKHQLIGHWSPFIFLRKSTILYLGLKSYPPSQMRSPPTEKPDFSCCQLQPQLSLLLLHPLLQHTQVFSYIYHHHSKKIKYISSLPLLPFSYHYNKGHAQWFPNLPWGITEIWDFVFRIFQFFSYICWKLNIASYYRQLFADIKTNLSLNQFF